MATGDKRRVAIAMFSTVGQLEAALSELSGSGVEDQDLCVVAREHAIGKMTREGDYPHLAAMTHDLADVGYYGGTEPLFASSNREVECFLRKSLDKQSVSQCLGAWIPSRQSKLIEQCLDRGEVVLWVNIDNDDPVSRVPEALLHHTNRAVQVHEISI